MKNVYLIPALLCIATPLFAEGNRVPPADRKAAVALVRALKANDRPAVAALMEYPMRGAVGSIRNSKEMIARYDEFFDAETIRTLEGDLNTMWAKSDETSLGQGGDIWIRNGKAFAINVTAAKQAAANAKKEDAPKVLFDCLTPKFHVRIQQAGERVRYASWGRKQDLSEKPDLELTGSMEMQGTSGGVIYTFKSGGVSYVVDDPQICESDCVRSLTVTKAGKTIAHQKCDEPAK